MNVIESKSWSQHFLGVETVTPKEKQNYPNQLFPVRTPPKHSLRYSHLELKCKAQNSFFFKGKYCEQKCRASRRVQRQAETTRPSPDPMSWNRFYAPWGARGGLSWRRSSLRMLSSLQPLYVCLPVPPHSRHTGSKATAGIFSSGLLSPLDHSSAITHPNSSLL